MREVKIAFALAWVIQIVTLALVAGLSCAIMGWIRWDVFFTLLISFVVACMFFFLWKPRASLNT